MKTKSRVEITPRDLGLLQFLHEYKVANIELVARFNFKMANKKVVQRRLIKLYHYGYVIPVAFINKSGPQIAYSLTPKGFDLAHSHSGFNWQRQELESGKIKHDLALVEIGEMLKSCNSVAEYVTENTMASSAYYQKHLRYSSFCRVRSDAMMLLKGKNHDYFVGVEYEATPKSADRWEAKLYDYHLESNISVVFYLCETLAIKNKIDQIEKELCQKFPPKVYTALRKDAISNSLMAKFENPFGQSLSLHFPK